MKKITLRKTLPILLGIFILGWLLKVLFNYIPFFLPSYTLWTGVLIALFGSIGLIIPLRKLGLNSRKRSAIILIIGVGMIITPIIWPVSIKSSDKPKQRLDDFLPYFQSTEYHEELAQVSLEKLDKAIFQVSLADMPMAVFLMKLRFAVSKEKYVPDNRPILEFTPESGFFVLDNSNPAERVFGMVGQPWNEESSSTISSPEEFIAFNKPENLKIAFNFRLIDKGEQGVLITTETRCFGNDKTAQKLFSRYWAIIYPGSSIIRRYWLRAIIAKAESL